MRRSTLGLILALVLSTAAPTTSWADPPDRLDHYQIVPRKSVLLETGGFAGVSNRYRLRGEYDFLREWTGGTPTEPYKQTARFDNADVRAPLGGMLPAFIDVDYLFNLEGLRGELLPLGAPFDVYHFQGLGNTSDAASPLEQSTVDLYAALVGPWMYLWGETTPPPWSADYFEYEIKAVARQGRWADWNEDGVVDAADYTAIRDQQATASDFDWATAYSDWSAQFGQEAPDGDAMFASLSAAVSTSTALAIPEPACLVLVAFGAAVIATRRP